MSQEEFVAKWRGELFALIFEAEASGLRSARLTLLDKSEKILRSIYSEMSVPHGPVPPKVLASCRELFNTVKDLMDKAKVEKSIPFDIPEKK